MSRELTRQEKAAIRSLVKRWCANYDKDTGCLPLDAPCYMLGKMLDRGILPLFPFGGAAP